jgi:hypothetical protein
VHQAFPDEATQLPLEFGSQPQIGKDLSPLPPGGGRLVTPHFLTFSQITNYASRTYRWAFDEALRHSRTNALACRRDPVVMDALRSRQIPTCQLPWHLEPENDKDTRQGDAVTEITKVIEGIPDFQGLKRQLLEALWFGRYGAQLVYGWDFSTGRKRLKVVQHRPINGDKLVFRYSGEAGVLVHANFPGEWMTTERGRAHFFTPEERDSIIIHRHEPEDADFFEPELAGSVEGVGIRSRIYWFWWLRSQVHAFLMDYLERVGAGGFTIYYYEAGSRASLEEVKDAAEEQHRNNTILFPRYRDGSTGGPGIQRIEPSVAGAQLLQGLVSGYFDEVIRRYILGQNLTSEARGTGLGSGVADLHADTFARLVKYDAIALGETLTKDLVAVIQKVMFPGLPPLKFVFDVDKPNAADVLASAQAFYNMGGAVDEDELRSIIGLAKPQPGHPVLAKMGNLAPSGMPGMGMMPAGVPMMGAPGPDMGPPGMDGGGGPMMMRRRGRRKEYMAIPSPRPEQVPVLYDEHGPYSFGYNPAEGGLLFKTRLHRNYYSQAPGWGDDPDEGWQESDPGEQFGWNFRNYDPSGQGVIPLSELIDAEGESHKGFPKSLLSADTRRGLPYIVASDHPYSMRERERRPLPPQYVAWLRRMGELHRGKLRAAPDIKALHEEVLDRPDSDPAAFDMLSDHYEEQGDAESAAFLRGNRPAKQRAKGPRHARPSRARARHYSRDRLAADPRLLELVRDYLAQRGLPDYRGDTPYHPVHPGTSRAIADYYQAAPHAPHDPQVRRAYAALTDETRAQYDWARQQGGIEFEPWLEEGQPYANSQEMRDDALGGHLYHYLGGDFPEDSLIHGPSGVEAAGHPHTHNDLFRAVHDLYGHALYGNQFGPRGEEHAWRTHSRMYSPQARPALSMETRGQNSWVNFGPHLRRPDGSFPNPSDADFVHPARRPYAEQKNNLLPPQYTFEGEE